MMCRSPSLREELYQDPIIRWGYDSICLDHLHYLQYPLPRNLHQRSIGRSPEISRHILLTSLTFNLWLHDLLDGLLVTASLLNHHSPLWVIRFTSEGRGWQWRRNPWLLWWIALWWIRWLLWRRVAWFVWVLWWLVHLFTPDKK